MSELAGPVFALAGLLAAAGVQKLVSPAPAVAALRTAGLGGTDRAVQILGLAEVGVAALVVAYGNRLSIALLACFYVAFAAFTARLVHRSGATASCGCFGASAAPATAIHVGVNVLAATLCLAAVVWPTGPLAEVLAGQPLSGIAFLVLTALCGWLFLLLLTVLPDVSLAMATIRSDQVSERS